MREDKEKLKPYLESNRIVYPGATPYEREAYEYLDREDPLLKRHFENGSVTNGKY